MSINLFQQPTTQTTPLAASSVEVQHKTKKRLIATTIDDVDLCKHPDHKCKCKLLRVYLVAYKLNYEIYPGSSGSLHGGLVKRIETHRMSQDNKQTPHARL